MKIGWVVLVAAIVVAVAAAYFLSRESSSVASPQDSVGLVRSEEKSLLRDAQAAFRENRRIVSLFHYPKLARPLRVHISGRNATLQAAGAMNPNFITYAQTWYEIYVKNHGDHPVVCMHVVWKGGGFYQTAPLDDIGLFVPKCPFP